MMQRLMRACVSRKLPPNSDPPAATDSNSKGVGSITCDNGDNSDHKSTNSAADATAGDSSAIDSPVLTRQEPISLSKTPGRRRQHKSLTLSLIRAPWSRRAEKPGKGPHPDSALLPQPQLEVEKRRVVSSNSDLPLSVDTEPSGGISCDLTAVSGCPTRSITIDFFPQEDSPQSPPTPPPPPPQEPTAFPRPIRQCQQTYREFKSLQNAYISEPRQLSSSFDPGNYRLARCQRPTDLPLVTESNICHDEACAIVGDFSAPSANPPASSAVIASRGSDSLTSDDLMLPDTWEPATPDPDPAAASASESVFQSSWSSSAAAFTGVRRATSLRQHQPVSVSTTSRRWSRPRSVSSPQSEDSVLVSGADLRQLVQDAAAMRLALLRLRRQLTTEDPAGDSVGEVCALCGSCNGGGGNDGASSRVGQLEARLSELQAEAERLRAQLAETV